jgi:hypothetical protein
VPKARRLAAKPHGKRRTWLACGVPVQPTIKVLPKAVMLIKLVNRLEYYARAEPPDQFALPLSPESGI